MDKFIHNKKSGLLGNIREIVFGAQDGMVSTMGAITGIAVGSSSQFLVVLSGLVIVSVEAISMAIGSYLSSKSVADIDKRKLEEEKFEIEKFPEDEKEELEKFYIQDGWPDELAKKMAEAASNNSSLFLKEMECKELHLIGEKENPLKSGIFMFFSYLFGGAIPVLPYLVFPIKIAIIYSLVATLFFLFLLGFTIAKIAKQNVWKAGMRVLILAGSAVAVGLAVGVFSKILFGI